MYGSPVAPMAPVVAPMTPVAVAPVAPVTPVVPMAPVAPVVAPVAPMYAPPPPPPPQAAPTVIMVNDRDDGVDRSPCATCGKDTGHIGRKVIGGVAMAWFCCLFWTLGWTGICCMPCKTDSCKDTELVCMKCHTVKMTVPANCF